MASKIADTMAWCIWQYFFWIHRHTKPFLYRVEIEGSAPLSFWDSGQGIIWLGTIAKFTCFDIMYICFRLLPHNARFSLICWSNVYSQTNPPTCTKFGASRWIRLTASPDFFNLLLPAPPPPPICPLRYWGATWILLMSIPRWIRRREPKLVPIGPAVWQLRKTFECLTPTPPQVPPFVTRGNLFGVYPFTDGYADVCQIWCQSVQPFDSFPDFTICDTK